MGQTKDIATILAQRDPVKYKAIIERAANNGYHDYKFTEIIDHPEYGECTCPKMQLVEDLQKFPELADISKKVMDGDYDEQADDQDKEVMRRDLINDKSPDALFIQLGLKVPTKIERALRRPVNN